MVCARLVLGVVVGDEPFDGWLCVWLFVVGAAKKFCTADGNLDVWVDVGAIG